MEGGLGWLEEPDDARNTSDLDADIKSKCCCKSRNIIIKESIKLALYAIDMEDWSETAN